MSFSVLGRCSWRCYLLTMPAALQFILP